MVWCAYTGDETEWHMLYSIYPRATASGATNGRDAPLTEKHHDDEEVLPPCRCRCAQDLDEQLRQRRLQRSGRLEDAGQDGRGEEGRQLHRARELKPQEPARAVPAQPARRAAPACLGRN